jgi:hypothetical protein
MMPNKPSHKPIGNKIVAMRFNGIMELKSLDPKDEACGRKSNVLSIEAIKILCSSIVLVFIRLVTKTETKIRFSLPVTMALANCVPSEMNLNRRM